jgi:glutamate synthase domain-containing protein 1
MLAISLLCTRRDDHRVCASGMAAIGTFYFPFGAISVITDVMTTHACGIVAPISWEMLTGDLPVAFSRTRERRVLGTLFMPRIRVQEMTSIVEETLHATGWTDVCWRSVPIRFESLDNERQQSMPRILQVAAIGRRGFGEQSRALDKVRVYLETHAARQHAREFAVVSLSTQTMIYKGLLSPGELAEFYPDLLQPAFPTPLAFVQKKIDSAARPLWSMAPPLHNLAHSGELRHLVSNCA